MKLQSPRTNCTKCIPSISQRCMHDNHDTITSRDLPHLRTAMLGYAAGAVFGGSFRENPCVRVMRTPQKFQFNRFARGG
jgi:hypothetical protein